MPIVYSFIAKYWIEIIIEAVLVTYSFVDANQQAIAARRRARDAYNASLQDRLLTIKSAISPWQYIVGTSRTGGAFLFADSEDANSGL